MSHGFSTFIPWSLDPVDLRRTLWQFKHVTENNCLSHGQPRSSAVHIIMNLEAEKDKVTAFKFFPSHFSWSHSMIPPTLRVTLPLTQVTFTEQFHGYTQWCAAHNLLGDSKSGQVDNRDYLSHIAWLCCSR